MSLELENLAEADLENSSGQWIKLSPSGPFGDASFVKTTGEHFLLCVTAQGEEKEKSASEVVADIERDDSMGVDAELVDASEVNPANGDYDAEEEDSEDNEPEVMTDGGRDVTEHVDDDTIEGAIERHDDPDHPDSLSVGRARNYLARIQRSFAEYWSEHMDVVEDGDMSVIRDTGDLLVLADHTGHGWSEEFEAAGIDDDTNRAVIKSIHHTVADQLIDYSWATADPFVVRKPDGVDDGARYVEAVINGLLKQGASPAEAWVVHGVEIRGHSQSEWARRMDRDQSTVNKSLKRAKNKLHDY